MTTDEIIKLALIWAGSSTTVYGKQRENELRVAIDAIITDRDDCRARLEAAERAILGVRNGMCWCGVGIGNPMYSKHSQACIDAQAVIKIHAESQAG